MSDATKRYVPPLLALVLALAATNCRDHPPPGPNVAQSASASKDASAGVAVNQGASEIRAVLFDPRFADAKRLHDAHDFRGEGNALVSAVSAGPAPLRADETCAVVYAAGRAFVAADDSADAIRAFDAASSDGCPLAPYAKIRGAQARARSTGAADALVRVQAMTEVPLMQDEKNLVVADCKWEQGAHADSVPLMRAWLKSNPHGQRWVDVALKIASFDLDAADEERAREAFDLSTRVLTEAPKLDPEKADDLRRRAAAASKKLAPLTAEEHVRRARAFLDLGDNARALEEALRASADPKAKSEDVCRAEMIHANAEHGKPAIADAWSLAIKRCAQNDDELVTALYSGAKAAASAKREKDAIEKFARVEEKFPTHRLADDARFRAANVYKTMGDMAQYEALLATITDKYPNGDMGDEGSFLVALLHLQKGDDAGAKPPLDRIIDRERGLNRSWQTGGRASYFRARIAERAGDGEDAKRRYAEVIAGVPLGYYAWLAHARLAAIDRVLADSAQRNAENKDAPDATRAHDPQDATRSHDGQDASATSMLGAQDASAVAAILPAVAPAAERDALTLARRLLAVGEVDLAKRALSQGGLTGADASLDDKVDVARVYDDAKKWDDGIAFSRGKTSEFYAHYPTGRWRAAWEAAYPRAFEDDVVRASGSNAVPATLTWAIMREESSFMPEVKSPANAYGLMQLIVPTAKLVARGTTLGTDEASLRRADVSIALGTKLLGNLRASLTHPLFAIAAYNGGAGAVKKWLAEFPTNDLDVFVELIPWDETRGYVKRVTMSELVYAYLYDRKGYDDLGAMPLVISR